MHTAELFAPDQILTVLIEKSAINKLINSIRSKEKMLDQ
jgi:hypothetical protein